MFKYYNHTPYEDNYQNCVLRAISTALDIPYYDVALMLKDNGKFNECDMLCIACYEKLLDDDIGLRHYSCEDMLVEDVANEYRNDIVLIRMNGHLTCSKFGIILDLFDCSMEVATDYWIV